MQLHRRRFLYRAAAAAMLPFAARAWALDCPVRPIKLVIPYPPGGVVDAIGRPLAERMKSLLGSMVVENVGGSGGEVGAALHLRPRYQF